MSAFPLNVFQKKTPRHSIVYRKLLKFLLLFLDIPMLIKKPFPLMNF